MTPQGRQSTQNVSAVGVGVQKKYFFYLDASSQKDKKGRMSLLVNSMNDNKNNKNTMAVAMNDQVPLADDDDSIYQDDQSLFEGEDELGSVGNSSQNRIAREDIRLMNVVRAIVMLCLLTFAFISSEVVFITSLIGEQNEFEDAYDDAAMVLTNTMKDRITNKIWIAKSFAKELAMSIHDSDSTPPFVSFDHFATRCKGPLHLSESTAIAFAPFVGDSKRSEWEEYVSTAHPLIETENPFLPSAFNTGDSVETADDDDVAYYPTQRQIDQGIYRFANGVAQDEENPPQGYFPVWQQAPPAESGDNSGKLVGTMFNLLSSQGRASGLQVMIENVGASVSTFLFQDSEKDDYAVFSSPRSTIYAPVLEPNPEDDSVVKAVGAVEFEFRWETVFANVLDGINLPLFAVVGNRCDKRKFTYQIRGAEVFFVGEGDDYHEDVDGYVVANSTFTEFEALFAKHLLSPEEVDDSFCSYQVSYFPSSSFKKHYVTNQPDKYRGMVLAVFFFFVVIFWLYDGLIERRQGNVIKEAEKSDAIVRSLFPSTVRDRLYEQSQAKKKAHDDKEAWKNSEVAEGEGGIIETPKNRLKSFMSKSPEDQAAQSSAPAHHHSLSDPIADLFPKTTIMFADVCTYVCLCLCVSDISGLSSHPTCVCPFVECRFRGSRLGALSVNHHRFSSSLRQFTSKWIEPPRNWASSR